MFPENPQRPDRARLVGSRLGPPSQVSSDTNSFGMNLYPDFLFTVNHKMRLCCHLQDCPSLPVPRRVPEGGGSSGVCICACPWGTGWMSRMHVYLDMCCVCLSALFDICFQNTLGVQQRRVSRRHCNSFVICLYRRVGGRHVHLHS